MMNDAIKAEIIKEQGGFCFYCPVKLRPAYTTLDHVLPASRGGKLERSNVVAACRNCNFEKSNLTMNEYRVYVALADLGAPPFGPMQLTFLAKLPNMPTWVFDAERRRTIPSQLVIC